MGPPAAWRSQRQSSFPSLQSARLSISLSLTHLGVKLDGEVGLRLVDDALVRVVVGVHEERLPALRVCFSRQTSSSKDQGRGATHLGEGRIVDGVSVVLGRDVAPRGAEVDAGDVHPAVAVPDEASVLLLPPRRRRRR